VSVLSNTTSIVRICFGKQSESVILKGFRVRHQQVLFSCGILKNGKISIVIWIRTVVYKYICIQSSIIICWLVAVVVIVQSDPILPKDFSISHLSKRWTSWYVMGFGSLSKQYLDYCGIHRCILDTRVKCQGEELFPSVLLLGLYAAVYMHSLGVPIQKCREKAKAIVVMKNFCCFSLRIVRILLWQ